MRSLKFLFLSILSFLSSESLQSQAITSTDNNLNIYGQIKPRGEFRDGFKTPLDPALDPAAFIEQRSRIGLFFNDLDKNNSSDMGAKLVVQDVRIYGSTGQINKTDPFLSIHEAYGYYKFYQDKEKPSDLIILKAGRQEIDFYNSRIMGNLDWAAQGRSHDAIRLDISSLGDNLSLAFAYNQDNITPEPIKLSDRFYQNPTGFGADGGGLPNYKYMFTFYSDIELWGFNLRVLDIYLGWQRPDEVVNLNTAGFMPSFKLNEYVTLKGEIYLQNGTNLTGTEANAYMANISMAAKVSDIKGNLGVDILSGTDIDEFSGQSSTFDPLFGTHHKFYGFMDYFYVGNANSQLVEENTRYSVGLVDIYANALYNITEEFAVRGDFHYFLSEADLYENGRGSDKAESNYLGTEFDLTLNYKPNKSTVFTLGSSMMLPSENMGIIKDYDTTEPQFWGYLMMDLMPSILLD